jgi:hypothetical protein
MKTLLRRFGWLAAVVAVCATPLFAAKDDRTGTLNVTLVSEDGTALRSTHIYVFNKGSKKLAGTCEATKYATLKLRPGIYQLYAAGTRLTGDGIEHYSSPEGVIYITPYEDTSAILNLKLVEKPDYGLTEAMLKKMNIDPSLARHLD